MEYRECFKKFPTKYLHVLQFLAVVRCLRFQIRSHNLSLTFINWHGYIQIFILWGFIFTCQNKLRLIILYVHTCERVCHFFSHFAWNHFVFASVHATINFNEPSHSSDSHLFSFLGHVEISASQRSGCMSPNLSSIHWGNTNNKNIYIYIYKAYISV